MSLDLPALCEAVARHGAVVRILIAAAAGSVPREAGASMLVWAGGEAGTIGGGELENRAVGEARALLSRGGGPLWRRIPLGPDLGQCCGGSVTLVWERFDRTTLPGAVPFARRLEGSLPCPPLSPPAGAAPLLRDGWLIEAAPSPRRPLWIWGAGHVGRAIVAVMAPWPGVAITWVDLGPERFPPTVPEGVTVLPAADPPALVPFVPKEAAHLVLTRSHALDLALCHALLGHGFDSLGLIGSATKWARFRSRLGALGHSPEAIGRIACPIGDPSLGKHPQAIAISVGAGLIRSWSGNKPLQGQGDAAA